VVEDACNTYIIIDTLDKYTEREELLKILHHIVNWKLETLHILVTSKKEKDIKEGSQHIVFS